MPTNADTHPLHRYSVKPLPDYRGWLTLIDGELLTPKLLAASSREVALNRAWAHLGLPRGAGYFISRDGNGRSTLTYPASEPPKVEYVKPTKEGTSRVEVFRCEADAILTAWRHHLGVHVTRDPRLWETNAESQPVQFGSSTYTSGDGLVQFTVTGVSPRRERLAVLFKAIAEADEEVRSHE